MATYELIAKNTLGSDTASLTFSSIPQTGYTDLVLICTTRSDRGGVANGKILVTFNSSTSNYSYRRLLASNTTVQSASASSLSSFDACSFTGCSAGNTSNTFGSTEVYIPNYTGSTNKAISATSVSENNGTNGYLVALAGLWADTSAITSMSIAEQSGYNFKSGSSFYLFGIAKA